MTNLRLDNIYNAPHILRQAQYDYARGQSEPVEDHGREFKP